MLLNITEKQPLSRRFIKEMFPFYYRSTRIRETTKTTLLNAMKRELTELNKQKKHFDELGNLRKKKEYEEKIQETVKRFNKKLGGLK